MRAWMCSTFVIVGRSLLAVILILALHPSQAPAQQLGADAPRESGSTAAAEVLVLERQIEEAIVRGDIAFVDSVTPADFSYVHGDAWTRGGRPLAIDDKAAFLQRVADKEYLVHDLDNVNVEMHGDVAITYGRYVSLFTPRNRDAAEPARLNSIWFERVYARREGQWQFLSHRTVHGPNVAPAGIDPTAAGAAAAPLSAASSPSTVDEHVAAARRVAGTEWATAADYFCVEGAATPNSADDPIIEPVRIFDNLYAIGRTSTVVYAITTSQGIILIDSGYADQVETVLLPGMAALGLDPMDIEYVIVAHGHGDHYGGSTYLQERYGARIVLSAEDWDLMEQQPVPPGRSRVPAPRRDVEAREGEPITVGEAAVVPVLVPGHTDGSLGLIFPVRNGAETHMAALFGGTILTSSRISNAGLEQYIDSLEHFGAFAAELGVDVEIQNHPLFDGMWDKVSQLDARLPGASHPFVLVEGGYGRFLSVIASCMRAELARRETR